MSVSQKMSSEVSEKNQKPLRFEVLYRDPYSSARVGKIETMHGAFETPVFMPVGTQGTVKSLTPKDLQAAGTEIILANTYHLYIRPGIDIIQEFGGLHRFMGWPCPILTDSGGYQVFSLSRLRKITEEGVWFHSHFDGRQIFLNPEKVIEIQETLASDIAMVFDECPPPTKDKKRIKKSIELTLHWSERAKKHHRLKSQALFGIIQGGTFVDLRRESLERTVQMDFDGYALGGLCVGEEKGATREVLEATMPWIPEEKPHYLMGVGTPIDFLEAIACGADLFDCVNPTRYGRTGAAFTQKGLVVCRNSKYKRDQKPIEEGCSCYACQNFSRSYIRHLFNAEEMLGPQLLSLHNVHFFVNFVRQIRQTVKDGTFVEFKKNFLNHFDPECR